MKKMHSSYRLLSLLLVFALVFSIAVPVQAETPADITWTKTDNDAVSQNLLTEFEEHENQQIQYADHEKVRVSIFLDQKSTMEAGFSTMGIGENASAMAYRDGLRSKQEAVTASIERTLGSQLDVCWNLTLAANAISANVEYGQIEAISKVPGVSSVKMEARYEPQVVEMDQDGEVDPNMVISAGMTGSNVAWQSGYTGAGMRIAIVDTGLDVQHKSVDPEAYAYALEENAKAAGKDYTAYVEGLDLLDAEEIAACYPELNIASRQAALENAPELRPEDLFVNEKVPFGFSYIDHNLNLGHEKDTMTEHGSHVAGISAANRFVQENNEFVSGESVGVIGNAPDAQLLVMKVFGANGGAYDSDYLAAIEDAIVLGCDSVNLSLGSPMPGFSLYTGTYGQVLEAMTESDTVVCISMGNNGHWAEFAANMPHLPYVDHMNFYTGGSPGSYKNPLTVASVDNDGTTGNAFEVAGKRFPYTETGMFCNKLLSLDTSEDGSGTDYEYVFLDGYGYKSDFEGIGIQNKVVFVSRGEFPFADKGNNLFELGAKAGIVYNNQPGVISMDLNMYFYMMPFASINMDQGNYIKEHSEKHTSPKGIDYYTGTFHMDHKIVTTVFNADFYNMSIFSSWGAPGDLTMKPDITTPGGGIYSINGSHADGMGGLIAGDHASYELMSGTSMAAPQMTGIAALILQSIEERGIRQEGLTNRALAQSLAMSTAVPMKDQNGKLYPLIQQGSGLANTAAATSADSYILVEGQKDGKVKAELRDDPERTGEYTFTFSVNNLEETEKVFALSADVFTQGVRQDYANTMMEDLAWFQTLDTTPVAADVTWEMDGKQLSASHELDAYDFNGDGKTDKADAQMLMDSVVTEVISDSMDVNGDGKTNTYDVHVLLSKLGTDRITVPAQGSKEITVTVTLTEEQKAHFDEIYTGGAYVEAYIYVEALSDAEGVMGTSHSIPMLAYYGSWTDNSMYDVGSYVEYTTGTENRMTYFNNMGSNVFAIVYGDRPNKPFYFGGNPMQPDQSYFPERNALNSERGDMIYEVNLAPSRNAIDSRFVVEQNGEEIYTHTTDTIPGAFFYLGNHSWQNAVITGKLKWVAKDFAEGDRFDVVFQLAPELYYDAEANVVDWDALGKGAELRYPVVVDNTDPVLEGVSLDLLSNELVVKASDNQYVAAVALFNATGTEDLTSAGAVQAEAVPGESYEYRMALDGINGKKFILQVSDYAMNTVTYDLEVMIGEELPMPEMMVFALDYKSWTVDDYFADRDNGFMYRPEMFRNIATVPQLFVAGTVVNHLVYASNEKGQLFVAPEEEMTDLHYVAQLPSVVADLAYNPVDGELYGIDENAAILRIDQITGEATYLGVFGSELGFVAPGYGYPIADTLAIDGEGRFYTTQFGSPNVFTYTLDNIGMPDYFTRTQLSSLPAGGEITQDMEWNPNDGQLYWHGTYIFTYMGNPGGYGFLIEMDPATGENTRYNVPTTRTGALIYTVAKKGANMEETKDVMDVQMTKTELTLHRGLSADLDAAVRPWFVTDASVVWASDNEAVAVVDQNGTIQTVDAGVCNITATSVLDPTKVGTCVLTVDTVDVKFEGLLKDENGVNRFFQWDMNTDKTWTPGDALDANVSSVAAGEGDILYVNSATPGGGEILKVSKTTGEILSRCENKAGVPMYDMTVSKYFSTPEAELVAGVWQWIFFGPTDPAEVGTSFFDLTGYAVPMFGLTSLGFDPITDAYGVTHDAEHFIALDGAYGLIDIYYFESEQGPNVFLDVTDTDLKDLGVYFRLYEEENKRSSLLTDGHGGYYASIFTGTQNDLFAFTYDAEKDIYHAEHLGRMGEDIWPAAIYEVTPGASRLPAEAKPFRAEDMVEIQPSELSLEELLASHDEPIPGTLNAVHQIPVQIQGADSNVDYHGKLVTVSLTTDEATTNGKVKFEYDPEILTLVDAQAQAEVFTLEENRMGYAFTEAVPAGTEILTVTFSFEDRTNAETDVIFTGTEHNETAELTTETVSVKLEWTCDHAETELRNQKEATCTEDGYTGDRYCTICEELLEQGEVIPAKGHTEEIRNAKEATCTEDGYTGDTYCTVCGDLLEQGEVIPAKGHTEEIRNAKEATCTEDGYTGDVYCTVCGELLRKGEVIPTNCPSKQFTDVEPDDWYHEYVDYMVENGLMKGMTETLFAPNAQTTRGQLVTILYRMAGSPAVEAENPFTDAHEGSYYYDAVLWAVENNIAKGMTETLFAPHRNVTREQMVTFLARYAEYQGKEIEGGTLEGFADAEDVSEYAEAAMAWAVENEIIEGMGGKLEPQGLATRAQIAAVIFRFTR